MRVAVVTLLSGAFALGTAGTAQALVADRPTDSFPDFNGAVEVIVHKGNRIYVGGEFTSVNGTARNHAAAVNARTGQVLSWNPNVNGEVHALAVTSEGIYVGGEFSQVGGRSRDNVAVVSARTGSVRKGFAPRTNRAVNAFTFSRRTAYLGGAFTTVDGKFRNGLAAVSRSRSAALRAWSPDAKRGQVTDLVRRGTGIYVGGTFRTLNDSSDKAFFGRVSARSGRLTRGFDPDASKQVLDLQVTRTRVYAALGGRAGGAALAVARRDGRHLFNRRFDGDVEAVKVMNKQVYVGGHFAHACRGSAQNPVNGNCRDGGPLRRKGASLSTSGNVTGWNPNLNSALGISALDTYAAADRLVVGGHFTQASGVNVEHFAVFN